MFNKRPKNNIRSVTKYQPKLFRFMTIHHRTIKLNSILVGFQVNVTKQFYIAITSSTNLKTETRAL